MRILAKIIHGSRLYGLEDPIKSDWDYKGIYLPPINDLILMKGSQVESHKVTEGNLKEEYENFSLQKFLKLCSNGEDCAMVMLHVQPSDILIDSDIYQYLRENRKKFYTKRINGSLRYAKSQMCKYALRAGRMKAVESTIKWLQNGVNNGAARVHQIWDLKPMGEYLSEGIEERNNTSDRRYFECSGKRITATVSPQYALEIFTNLYESYGSRVKIAKSLDGQDWKAISHSFRVGFQLKSIYLNANFSYPLPETEFIKRIKSGSADYLNENVDEQLNNLISEVEQLAEKSTFPEKVDQDWLDSIILDQYK